ncbi:MAG: acyltransferase, partial [Pseudomonadota bacterium]
AGQMGVLLFFMLSGYLMARIYGPQIPTPQAIRGFLMARVARILPIYWTVLGLSALAGWMGLAVHYQVSDPGTLAQAALMIWAPQELWSIPVEVQFYAVFLLLWPWIFRVRLTPLRIIGALGALTSTAVLTYAAFDDALILLTCALPFILGLLCARIPEDMIRRLSRLGLLALLILCLNLPGVRGLFGMELWSGFYPRLWLDPLRYLAAMFCLITAIGAPGRWVIGGPLVFLGRISFGFYLLHRPVIRALTEALPQGIAAEILLLLSFTVSLALAYLSFHLIEQPAARRLMRPVRRLQRPQPSAG